MMFKSPFLAKCSDRNSMPKQHPTSGAPEDWFSAQMLEKFNLSGLTFDFFVDWSATPPVITPIIWIKKVLDSKFSYKSLIEQLNINMTNELGMLYLNVLESFRVQSDLTVQFIVFKDELNWKENDSTLLVINFCGLVEDEFEFTYEEISIDTFKTIIQKHSGGPIKIGSKGLYYGTSNLECFLSHTNSLYPGDVDLVVFNEDVQPIAIIEYKKHTLSTPISQQQISNYYPRPDARKYNRLSILRDYLNKINPNIPIFILYFPTQDHFTEGRLELLKGDTNALETRAASNFDLPKSKTEAEYNALIKKLLKAITYHNSL